MTGEQAAVADWLQKGWLPNLSGKVLWDVGCGTGVFSRAFLDNGAEHVYASDIAMNIQNVGPLADDPGISFIDGDLKGAITQIGAHGRPSIIFMHLMTEHVYDLRSFMKELREVVGNDDVEIFIHHGNYFQPVGHHDFPFLDLDPATYSVRRQTVDCWNKPEKCFASEEHRAKMLREISWQWGHHSQKTADGNCETCNYRLRSEPWAHLLHRDRFMEVWPEPFYAQMMNKTTPFQVIQYSLEAGFEIAREERSWAMNEIDERLLADFARGDLSTYTQTVWLKAKR